MTTAGRPLIATTSAGGGSRRGWRRSQSTSASRIRKPVSLLSRAALNSSWPFWLPSAR
ncbi:MAG: hypothetical protein OZSIB_2981 [Candidatus Ozemobacter sibiricus]|uniref:Uncharacterized protein n=1 Tax=Candidatus Ozemobacter sibiricus TaxID=2268124 RepID=A0A367ZRC6_9BACT|nr:MAG: hypothetical protein OZSIB_2981 [Candidatus Ozemobacter sibiricus]